MNLIINGMDITVEKKRIKNMHIHIKPPAGDVLVTVPMRISDREIERFIYSKEDWIIENVNRIRSSSEVLDSALGDGDRMSVWGDVYTISLREGKRFSVSLEDGENGGENIAVLTVKSGSTDEQKEKFMTEWYRGELTERVNVLLPQWEKYTGLKCSSWQSKNMKSRWGTCNTATKKIWLNVQLAKYPVECLEYVILHELAHTVVPNHGANFKSVLDRFMPDWKERRKRLKR